MTLTVLVESLKIIFFLPSEIMDAVKNTLFPGAGGTDSTAADGVPWWMKYVAKALAILSAVGQCLVLTAVSLPAKY